MKHFKTFLFIMKHGRIRLGLVKKIRNRDYMNKYGQAWNLPRFDPCPAPIRGPKTDPPIERIRPEGSCVEFAEAMGHISDRIEYKMAIQNFSEIAKEYFAGSKRPRN